MTRLTAFAAAGCAALLGTLIAGGVASADERSDAIAAANKAMAEEAARFNEESKYKFALEVDWASVKEFSRDKARSWGEKCGGFITELRKLCVNSENGKGVPACSDYVNSKVKKLQCSVTPDSSNERVELKGTTFIWYMASGGDSTAQEKMRKTIPTLLPEAGTLRMGAEMEHYLSKQDGYKSAKLNIDTASFKAGGAITTMDGILTYCVPAWDFLGMLNHPECQLKTCKGDGKKKAAFVDGAKQLSCTYSKEPKVAEKKGDTLIFYTGEWASKTGSYAGIPWNTFSLVRSKLKIRDCGVDEKSMDPRGGGGIMISEARKECCAKEGGKCTSLKFDGYEEVCKPDGFSTEKKCWKRDILDKKSAASAK